MNRTFVNVGAAGVIAVAAMSFSGLALAGKCPADKLVPDGQGQGAGATMPKDVTDTVLASIDLSKLPAKINIRANYDGDFTGSVVFGYDSNSTYTVDNKAPRNFDPHRSVASQPPKPRSSSSRCTCRACRQAVAPKTFNSPRPPSTLSKPGSI